jgi:isopentenyl-diphosphate delta-isomerase type 1
MPDPAIQVVDENDQPIGSASKQEIWEKGLTHRIIRVMIEDEHGRALLQKRAPTKQPYPGRWDHSVAGHVDVGEDYETAARREINEELGIVAKDLEELGSFRSNATFEWRKLNRFNRVYRLRLDSHIQFRLDPEEATEARWFELDELKQLVKDKPEEFSYGFPLVLERYYS